ncbi:acyloxyacyl hydrolase [Photobacterium satsumensis]|uniref:acyloxyacyl hydrolase n=1 Tax=Photobacterium satsumensis TaxID=2910239 RepID=UPI003D1367A1
MIKRNFSFRVFIVFFLLIGSSSASAIELAVSAGKAQQPGEDYSNSLLAMDLIFADWQRSPVQRLSLGASVTHLEAHTDESNDELIALSLFPELKLFAERYGYRWFFQVRALGPTWLSEKQLGEREQAMHFAFLAQVGGGVYFGDENRGYLNVFYRHFSNANLKEPNDGFDVPLNLSVGYRF